SNLKNNLKNVRVWNYGEERFTDTGRQFCGLMMGDHSKSGINTMFNTGSVVGVSANIFGSGFPRTFIPSFSWGGAQGFITYEFNKALEVMPKVFERRKKPFTEEDVEILKHIFERTKKYRR
ncbi:MAG: glucose-1-phosphate thymidylyltransferase, partial [Cyclobacteriaceae bacterium]|nr:glucose-1-phosphate thymidylyltransferase [Cyclobacteriaceae bacterium]